MSVTEDKIEDKILEHHELRDSANEALWSSLSQSPSEHPVLTHKQRMVSVLYPDLLNFIKKLAEEELPPYSLITTSQNERQLVFSNSCIEAVPLKICKDRIVKNSFFVKYLGVSDKNRNSLIQIEPFHLYFRKENDGLFTVYLCRGFSEFPAENKDSAYEIDLEKLTDEAPLEPLSRFLNLVLQARGY
ncbi:MAG: hypothetical protein SFU25_04140 [Candidatus Caenarcaniphilales bacterium]|nr:hypothetical protein [Candidatus Caenarcaniphilales bacterium]